MVFCRVFILCNYSLCQTEALYKHGIDPYNKQMPFNPVFTDIP
jgi:hypothetical protein